MPSRQITKEAVYLCTGNPLPKDIEQISYWLLNESFSDSLSTWLSDFNFYTNTHLYWLLLPNEFTCLDLGMLLQIDFSGSRSTSQVLVAGRQHVNGYFKMYFPYVKLVIEVVTVDMF
ncbi:hypothetical protein ACFE04_012016 [Oxalis oulophora]